MKWFKLLTVMVTLGIVLAGIGLTTRATPASANAGPHGNYTLTTGKCAGCHRAHTAVGEDLLREENVYALCTSCHSGTVNTDVVHGVKTGGTGTIPLNGGGFESVAGQTVASSHTVEGVRVGGVASDGLGTAWGSQNGDGVGVGDLGVGVQSTLECTSCHNTHGSSNYRILRDSANGRIPTGKTAAIHRWVPDDPDLLDWVDNQVLATEGGGDYEFDVASDCPTATNHCKAKFTSGLPLPTLTDPQKAAVAAGASVATIYGDAAAFPAGNPLLKGMNAFCATCHKSYLTLSGSATKPSTDGSAYVYPGTQNANDLHGSPATASGNVARYRHAMERTYSSTSKPQQPLRFAAEGTDPNVATPAYNAFGCITCHFAHGTSAGTTGIEAGGSTTTYADGVTPAGDSALLVYPARGVCISCHQKDKMAPAPP